MIHHLTVAFRKWTQNKRIDIPLTKNNARTQNVMIKIGFETIKMSCYEFAAALETLSTVAMPPSHLNLTRYDALQYADRRRYSC